MPWGTCGPKRSGLCDGTAAGLCLSLLLVGASTAGSVSVSVVAESGVGDGHPAVEVPVGRATCLAAAPDGGFYFCDNTRVRNVDAAGVTTTVIGQPYSAHLGDGGPARDAAIGRAGAVAVGPDGTVFVADESLHRIRAILPGGTATTVAGNGQQGYSGDGGPAIDVALSMPRGIAVGAAGNLYIAEGGRIRKVVTDGGITTIAGIGERGSDGDGGPATAARLVPIDVTVDAAGNVFLIDSSRRTVRRIDAGGTIVSLPLGEGVTDIATGPDGLYFARRGQVWRYTPDGQVELVAGVGGYQDFTGDDGPATKAKFGWIGAIAVAPDGVLYIADHGNKRIRRVDAEGVVTTVAGNGTWGMFGDGGPANGSSFTCTDLALAPDGRLFISDMPNHRIAVIDTKGIIDTYAGTGEYGFEGDGGPARQAPLHWPTGVALAADGTLYIADSGNKRVRKVSPTGIITTVGGAGGDGFWGDGGPATAATIDRPGSLALAADGSLYVTDYGNRRVRRIDPAGAITTVAGNGDTQNAPEGAQAAAATLGIPDGIALRPDGTLLIAISAAHRVKEVRSDGTLWTVAGNGIEGFAGDGGPASQAHLRFPESVAVAPNGAIWIADTGNARVRRVAEGRIDTALRAGEALTAAPPTGGDVVLSGTPAALRMTADGTAIYICDGQYQRILRVQIDQPEAK